MGMISCAANEILEAVEQVSFGSPPSEDSLQMLGSSVRKCVSDHDHSDFTIVEEEGNGREAIMNPAIANFRYPK